MRCPVGPTSDPLPRSARRAPSPSVPRVVNHMVSHGFTSSLERWGPEITRVWELFVDFGGMETSKKRVYLPSWRTSLCRGVCECVFVHVCFGRASFQYGEVRHGRLAALDIFFISTLLKAAWFYVVSGLRTSPDPSDCPLFLSITIITYPKSSTPKRSHNNSHQSLIERDGSRG